MEAATLKKKKNAISKGKLKKTMKNILCRPDPVFWPVVSEEHGNRIINVFQKHKVEVPKFKKPHWSEIKAMPKQMRPKAPKLKKVEGILFGITTCARSIPNGSCDAVIIDSEVNPRILVQHVVDACVTAEVPIICLKELKKTTSDNFGFPSCCLGVKKGENVMSELRNMIIDISKSYGTPRKVKTTQNIESSKMEVDEINDCKMDYKQTSFTYLYRTSKKSRVFTPPTDTGKRKNIEGFVGQDFIEFGGEQEKKPVPIGNSYMKMIVKRITNNPNRKKK